MYRSLQGTLISSVSLYNPRLYNVQKQVPSVVIYSKNLLHFYLRNYWGAQKRLFFYKFKFLRTGSHNFYYIMDNLHRCLESSNGSVHRCVLSIDRIDLLQ